MAKLIDKDALVAEIERRYDEKGTFYAADVLYNLKEWLDTLEVKEVDFGTEVYKYIGEHFKVYDDGNQTLQNKDKNTLIGRVDAESIAKHFFELGLKAKQG